MDPVTLTTVIPTYNEGDELLGFLESWASTGLSHTCVVAKAIVIDDGSRPDDAAVQQRAVGIAMDLLRAGGSAHCVEYRRTDRNAGKGAAIRLGWRDADAQSAWLSFIDADGAVPAREYWRLAGQLPTAKADVVCGSRMQVEGRSVTRSQFRRLQGRVFATLVDQLLHLGMYDTQCGIKFFRGDRLRPLLPSLQEDRWLLDVELLTLLKDAGASCTEIPIDCHERGGSSLIVGLDPLKMIVRLVQLRRRLRGGQSQSS